MEEIQIGFTGDTCFTGKFLERLGQNQPVFSAGVQQKLLSMDFVIANLEGPFCEGLISTKPGIVLSNPPQALSALASNNIQIFNLANNHIMDFGNEGLNQTLDILNKKHLPHFGAGLNEALASCPVYLEKNGITIALIGCAHKEGMMATAKTPGVSYAGNTKLLQQQVAQARQNADWVVLNYHGGEEFTRFPQPSRRKLLRQLLRLPVDFIIAHHPHVAQGVEEFNGKYIFWSLGNFIFDFKEHRHLPYVNQSMLPIFHLTKSKFEFHLYPLRLNVEQGILEEANIIKFKEQMEVLSDFSDYRGKWRKEAARVFWGKRNKPNADDEVEYLSNSQSRYFKKAITALRLIRDENQRPLLLAALQEEINKKLNIK